jgi:hypothetical protein
MLARAAHIAELGNTTAPRPCCNQRFKAVVQARDNGQKVRALRTATENVAKYTEWHKTTTFLRPAALEPWRRYCCVLGQHQGCVVLRIRIGALVREVCAHGTTTALLL